ncbi:MAG TPA: hypothetical protein EYH30_07135 [Anaerolineales bacterium]|nr:hypothetical protein [Anaerolineales bacterium]
MDKGTITILVGTYVVGSGGIVQDNTREVQFEGEELARRTEYGYHKGNITDTRGVTETLYRTEDGRLIIHVEDWRRRQGEPTTYSLFEVTEKDLGIGGRFEALGREAGFGRPLTIDEALAPQEQACEA